ncbi:NAD(P)-binding protein [Exidia glandulosa HHB12029]|uniref:NAD(P)-binding protein n=1 Tax=Exidia glandulosa HHB12029 TaxID=1314781 RepID=A0A165J2D8_EXIGL|nr:NAD(P)-binding protein [Exidia glandulosa HHB12029]
MAPSSTTATGVGILVKGDAIARPFQDELKRELDGASRPPRLVGILATSGAPSRMYAEFTRKACTELGFDFVLRETGAAVQGSDAGEGDGAEEAILEANVDPAVDGIMVYYPIYGGTQDQYLQQVVSPFKDVEGLHFQFHYNLYHNIRYITPASLLAPAGSMGLSDAPLSAAPPPGTVKSILPCTPLAVIKTLEHCGVYNALLAYGDRAYGRTILVINRSEVVGRPLAALLANDGARVFSADIDSIQEYTKRPPGDSKRFHARHVVRPSALSLEECLALADVVVGAVPSASYKVGTSNLKDGCVCINVSSEKNFETDVRQKASIYVPAVGRVTIMMLLRNLCAVLFLFVL